ncbi:MAG: TonB-dependent receptor plug domain-containing protein [Parvularculaceae bacterium]
MTAAIDPEVVRAVEVVRGPTSALYGSGALGGVIALRTIEAGDMLGEGETIGPSVGLAIRASTTNGA